MLAAVSLDESDLDGPPASVAGCGLDYAYISVHDDAVSRARLRGGAGVDQFCLLSWDAVRSEAHVRVFLPGAGVPEDPATGSAALGLGVWLVANGLLPGDGESSYVVRQGSEIHRPSTLEARVSAAGSSVVRTTVTGHVVPIATGEIAVPPFIG
jgi:trans-2,3-dihydro-3-hydroxyanthranilate isomerase